MNKAYERGAVFWTELDPVRGSEIAKTRPCVVISKTAINQRRNTLVVIPLSTTKSPSFFPLLIDTASAGPTAKARIEQVRTVDKSRVKAQKGFLNAADMADIEAALKEVLVLS
jgi:mRNA interferase MazF